MVKGKNGQIQIQEPVLVIRVDTICPGNRRNRPDRLAILVGRKEETLLTGEWQEFEVNSVFNSFYAAGLHINEERPMDFNVYLDRFITESDHYRLIRARKEAAAGAEQA